MTEEQARAAALTPEQLDGRPLPADCLGAYAPPRALGTVGPAARYTVEQNMHEVQLKDGSLHRFHFVRAAGTRDQWLRAVRLSDAATFAVIDLRKLSHALAAELPGYVERDVPGLVKYTLRPLFPDAAHLLANVVHHAQALGRPEPLQ